MKEKRVLSGMYCDDDYSNHMGDMQSFRDLEAILVVINGL